MNSALLAMFDWLECALQHESERRLFCDVSGLELAVTVSDGEGTGSVAVGMWNIQRCGERPQITTSRVPDRLLQKWSLHSQTVIAPVEAVGPLLALATWPDLREKLWVHFIDNMAAKDSLIRGSSVNADLNELMHSTWRWVKHRELHLWAEYVCTGDNPIDKASRGCTDDLYGEDWILVPPGDWEKLLESEYF